jgi:hypothetical protein
MEKIRLYGFNNLTKSLSFNIYDVCYAVSDGTYNKTNRIISINSNTNERE